MLGQERSVTENKRCRMLLDFGRRRCGAPCLQGYDLCNEHRPFRNVNPVTGIPLREEEERKCVECGGVIKGG